MNDNQIKNIPSLISQIYSIVKTLEEMYPDRYFTPDGHMVGSIGEVMARYVYDLELLPNSSETHDAKSKDGRMIQIKTTQIEKTSLSSKPNHLIVLKLNKDGNVAEIYNGPGEIAWDNSGKMQKNGLRYITLAKLKELMKNFDKSDKLPQIRTVA